MALYTSIALSTFSVSAWPSYDVMMMSLWRITRCHMTYGQLSLQFLQQSWVLLNAAKRLVQKKKINNKGIKRERERKGISSRENLVNGAGGTLLRLVVRVSMPGLAAPLDSMKADSLSLRGREGEKLPSQIIH